MPTRCSGIRARTAILRMASTTTTTWPSRARLPAVRVAWLLVLFAAAWPAHADLYRWVDPRTGSVKFSNHPPPWHGDPAREGRSPKVEVIPSQAAASKPAATAEKPGGFAERAPAPAGAASSAPKDGRLADLEARWRDLLEDLGTFNNRADFERAGAGLRQQVEAYDAVRAELDRIDPAGAARRRSEEGSAIDQVKKGIQAWLRR